MSKEEKEIHKTNFWTDAKDKLQNHKQGRKDKLSNGGSCGYQKEERAR